MDEGDTKRLIYDRSMRLDRLFVVPIALAVALLGGCERAKTRLDREVDRLCAFDGGVRIYETVVVPKGSFGPNGQLFPQYHHLYKQGGHLGPDFRPVVETEQIVSGDPALRRVRVAVVRRSTGKVIGEFIDYQRTGGDFPGPGEGSHKVCPQSRESGAFYKRMFIEEAS